MNRQQENIKKNEALDALYDKHKQEFFAACHNATLFTKYGIIDTDNYNSEAGILLICKETNDLNISRNYDSDFRLWLQDVIVCPENHKGAYRGFWYQVGRWVKLCNAFQKNNVTEAGLKKLKEELKWPSKELLKYARTIAITNVNKGTGGSSSGATYAQIAQYEITREILKKEIEILDPKYVLCGSAQVFDTIAATTNLTPNGNNNSGRCFRDKDGRYYMKLLHPASRKCMCSKLDDIIAVLNDIYAYT